jgi:membrane protease YdiL (CAAX protease family)
MVNLENPYAFNRPRPSHYATIAILFIAAYLVRRIHSFAFIYEFTLPILMVLLIAYVLDRTVLSKKTLIGGEFPELGRIYFFVFPILMAAAFSVMPRIFKTAPMYYAHFSSAGSAHRGELFVLMLLIYVPATEIIFRSYFQHLYSHLFGKHAGPVISAITYPLYFLLFTKNAFVIGYAAAMGALFSYISYRESSILPCIIAHTIIVIALFVFRF